MLTRACEWIDTAPTGGWIIVFAILTVVVMAIPTDRKPQEG
jgi:hypothetical protein